MLAWMWSNRDSYTLLGEMQNGTSTVEDSLVVSCKTEYTPTIWPSNHTPWHLLKGAENLWSHRIIHTDVYSISIHNFQAKMSFSEWLDEKPVVLLRRAEYEAVEKCNEPLSHEKEDMEGGTLTASYLVKGANKKSATYSRIPTIRHWERHYKDQWLAGVEEKEGEMGRKQRILRAVPKTVMMETCPSNRTHNAQSEP